MLIGKLLAFGLTSQSGPGGMDMANTADSIKTLSDVSSGEKTRLLKVYGGKSLCSRLEAMGLVCGTEIDVLSNLHCGPVRVAVGECRLSLGRNIASKLLVE